MSELKPRITENGIDYIPVSYTHLFGDTLVEIFRNARKEQLKNRMQYGELYHTNYYKAVSYTHLLIM